MTNQLSFDFTLDCTHDEAIDKVTEALKAEGFGVLTRIDMHDAFKEKLGIEFRRYTILGACNPPLAHKALTSRPDIGLLLPCNITVEELDATTRVRIIDPAEMMSFGDFSQSENIPEVAEEAHDRLAKVASLLSPSRRK